jgi:hypothetical protein
MALAPEHEISEHWSAFWIERKAMAEVILIAESGDDGALKELSFELQKCAPPGGVKIVSSKGFTGQNALTAIFGLGLGTIISALSAVLFAWMHKHKHCKIKINGIEISGYSAEDTLKLLKQAINGSTPPD